MCSCWAAPCCAGTVAALLPGEQLSHCWPHTRCTAEALDPYWAATAGRTAVGCPAPAAEEYQEKQALPHLQREREGAQGVYHIVLVRDPYLMLQIRLHYEIHQK